MHLHEVPIVFRAATWVNVTVEAPPTIDLLRWPSRPPQRKSETDRSRNQLISNCSPSNRQTRVAEAFRALADFDSRRCCRACRATAKDADSASARHDQIPLLTPLPADQLGRPIARVIVHAARQHHAQHVFDVLLIDCRLLRDRYVAFASVFYDGQIVH